METNNESFYHTYTRNELKILWPINSKIGTSSIAIFLIKFECYILVIKNLTWWKTSQTLQSRFVKAKNGEYKYLNCTITFHNIHQSILNSFEKKYIKTDFYFQFMTHTTMRNILGKTLVLITPYELTRSFSRSNCRQHESFAWLDRVFMRL